MLGSQAIETAIGLAVMFFIVSLGASTIVEIGSRLMTKRAKDLEHVVGALLAGRGAGDDEVGAAIEAFRRTSVHHGLAVAAGKRSDFDRRRIRKQSDRRPSYISARSFAEAAGEMITSDDKTPEGLVARLDPIVREVGGDIVGIKAGLERWFDETMERLGGAYKRWATGWLFAVGLVIAVVGNASVYDTAESLWNDTAIREAVAEAATNVGTDGIDPSELAGVAQTIDELQQLQLPVGWDAQSQIEWDGSNAAPWNWSKGQLATAIGWLATALMVTLGAPFWFDLLQKLVSLRSNGAKPKTANSDASSATARVMATVTGPATRGTTSTVDGRSVSTEQARPPDPDQLDVMALTRQAFGLQPGPTGTDA